MKARMINGLAHAEHDGYFIVARQNGISVLRGNSGVGRMAYAFGAKTESVFTALATLSAEGQLSYAITRNK